jgi:hypothetical protein
MTLPKSGAAGMQIARPLFVASRVGIVYSSGMMKSRNISNLMRGGAAAPTA